MKNIILGIVFVFGIMSTADAKVDKNLESLKVILTEVDCNSAYTICDNWVNYLNGGGNLGYELQFRYFDQCMTANAC